MHAMQKKKKKISHVLSVKVKTVKHVISDLFFSL